MVGIILTGHGNFATGILSSLKLIAGEQENLRCVDFIEGDSTEALEKKLKCAISELNTDEILVLSDLAGGSPFKISVLLSQKLQNKNMRVLAGTNLGMLLEVSLCRDGMNVNELIDFAINSGNNSIKAFELKKENKEEVDFVDGI